MIAPKRALSATKEMSSKHRFEFDSWIERFDREVDVRVVFNATPSRKATRLDPPEYVEIEDLALEATDTPDSATPEELERLMKDDTVMSIFKRDAYDWLEKNTQHQNEELYNQGQRRQSGSECEV